MPSAMKSGLVSALLLCACLIISTSSTKRNKKQYKQNNKITHHALHHHPKAAHTKAINKTQTKLKKSIIPNLNDQYIKDDNLAKKFDITAHPQRRPDMMTVVMKGLDGKAGIPGAKGDSGLQGPPGTLGEMGDEGAPGVCRRNECENEKLKSLIQRLLALEKYVNSLKNKKNVRMSCPNVTTVNVPFTSCAPKLFAIVPILRVNKPKVAASQNAAEIKKPKEVQTSSQGGVSLTRGTQRPTPIITVTNRPTGTDYPTATSSIQRPAATPPPPPFYITLQGATTYDTPVSVMSQQHGVPYLRTYKTVPHWVTSGVGPIDLKPSLYRRTYSRTPQQNFYSPGWTGYKRDTIPYHGLLTHKLATKMLHEKAADDNKSNTYKK